MRPYRPDPMPTLWAEPLATPALTPIRIRRGGRRRRRGPRHCCLPMSLTHHLTAGDILNALRGASCPYSALHLYSLLRLRLCPSEPSYFAWRAAVFTFKPLSAASSLPLLSHFHGHLLRSNLLAYPHVASSLLRSYSLLSPPAAHQLFDQIPSTTCNLYVLNVMLASLCRSSDLDSARTFFDGIPDKDVVSWSTMLACYFSNVQLADGLAFFRTMTFTTDIAVDCAMLATLLTSCASAGFLPLFCRAIHGYAVRHSIPASMHLGTALIDYYAKTNRIEYATRVFARMTKRNVVHWTIMICGMGSQLHNIEAVHLFEEMCQRRVQPSEMTFTAVLSACVNAGLVDKGKELFKLMVDRYRLEPNIHHYGCMVDLYAKAGLLEDAYEVIKTMKVEPNVIIWTSLLAACKKAKNFEIAIEGMEKVLALEISDENVGLYMLISDLYAMGGRWDNVLKIRRLVEERDVWKNTRPLSTRWSPPAPGMLKINSDGAFLQDRGTGAAGAVVRDSSGNFCAASARWLGPVGSVLIAEARGDSRWLASDSTRNHGTHHRGD
ncbi:pentatricopeptide repeat-containing protein At1g33350-like [Miscanthus floridulus]|uniref:pentatricopeptide repeat-containing protein At1g33350-like n=1 Tax=Miscanthus floridulus TaxID=154761 RepID=UPI00345974C9